MATMSFKVSRTVILADDEWDEVEARLLGEVLAEVRERLGLIEIGLEPKVRRIYEHGRAYEGGPF